MTYIEETVERIAEVKDADEIQEILYEFYIVTQSNSKVAKELDSWCRE